MKKKKQRKISLTELILSIPITILVIYILTLFVTAITNALPINPTLDKLMILAFGIILPSGFEIIEVIIPYIEQNMKNK